jgi:hypothetical protein
MLFHTLNGIFYTNKAHYSLIFEPNLLYLPKNSVSEQQSTDHIELQVMMSVATKADSKLDSPFVVTKEMINK